MNQAVAAADTKAEAEVLRELMMGFQSLGEGCEFGLVQRRFKAEPLGLLRFTIVPFYALIAALEARLEGVGQPEHTDLLVPDGSDEWYTTDRRWIMGAHTWILREGTTHEALFPELCRRLQYLRDRLLADLAAAEKINVFQHHGTVSAADALRLSAVLRQYGDNKLLVVRPQAEPMPYHSLTRLDDHTLLATLPRVVKDFAQDEPMLDTWQEICRTTRAIWPAASRSGPTS